VTLLELARGLAGITIHGDASAEVTALHVDSRAVGPGDAFVAIPGANADGHDYIPAAVAAGARVVVSERAVELPGGVINLVVADARASLAVLARNFYGDPSRSLTLVGITGTNGKTSTAYLAQRVLEAGGFPCARFGTVAHDIAGIEHPAATTTPDALELNGLLRAALDGGQTAAVAEASSHALVGRRLDGVRLQVAAWTNLTQDHLDFHRTMDEYRDAKLAIFDHLAPDGGAALNADDPYCDDFAAAAQERAGVQPVTYGVADNAGLRAEDIQATAAGATFTLARGSERTPVRLSLLGAYNVHNALAALAIGFALDLAPDAACDGVESLRTVPGRFEPVDAGQNFTAAVDYAHTPDALEHLLAAARALGSGRVIAVFGCGGDRDRSKRPIMGRIGAAMSDVAIMTSDNPRSEDPAAILREVAAGAPEGSNTRSIVDREEAIAAAVAEAEAGDIVLIAGKGHEDYQILGDRRIDFDDRQVLRDHIRAAIR
jgi:UDP-N-acetylmuramoyl-L-alanyl-D-glutamate--2,6-diaminopimelate ligase